MPKTIAITPSWFWPEAQPRITSLIHDLGLTTYPQHEAGRARHQLPGGDVRDASGYPMEPASWRVRREWAGAR